MSSRLEVKSPVVEFYSRAFTGRGRKDYLFVIENFRGKAEFYMNVGLYSVPYEAIR